MAKRKTKRKPVQRSVNHDTITNGRRDRSGKSQDLFVRVERKGTDVSISLGSAPEKLQIRCTLAALREAVQLAEK